MRTLIKHLAVILSLTVAAVSLTSGPAFALHYWAQPETPLAAKTDGVVQGRAYGYHEIDQTSNGTRSHAETRIYDNKPGGDGIYIELHTYVNSGYCISPEYLSCTQQYYKYAQDQSARWVDNSWSPYHWSLGTTGLPATADYARGAVKVCEDQSLQTDDCSGWAYAMPWKY